MAAGDRRGSGSATLAAGTPGSAGSINVVVSNLATSDTVVITPSYTAAQTIKDAQGTFNYYVVKASGSFTIYSDRAQNPAVVFDYLVYTTA